MNREPMVERCVSLAIDHLTAAITLLNLAAPICQDVEDRCFLEESTTKTEDTRDELKKWLEATE